MKISDDPFVLELLPEFVETWLEDVNTQFKPLLENENSTDLYRLGHTLKGSCYQFGLDEIAALGIELMGYAKSMDWKNASLLESKILQLFNEVKEELKNLEN